MKLISGANIFQYSIMTIFDSVSVVSSFSHILTRALLAFNKKKKRFDFVLLVFDILHFPLISFD